MFLFLLASFFILLSSTSLFLSIQKARKGNIAVERPSGSKSYGNRTRRNNKCRNEDIKQEQTRKRNTGRVKGNSDLSFIKNEKRKKYEKYLKRSQEEN